MFKSKWTKAQETVVKAEGFRSVSASDRSHLTRVLIHEGHDAMLDELQDIRTGRA